MMRLEEISRTHSDRFSVLRPSKNTNFGQWGHRLFSRSDIDQIIYQSKLVIPKVQVYTQSTACTSEFKKSAVEEHLTSDSVSMKIELNPNQTINSGAVSEDTHMTSND